MSSQPQRETALIRPLVKRLHPYVPGEQPKIRGLIKLNTNENPYPPSLRVLEAIRAAADGRLRLYPNPTAQPLREKLAEFHGCKPENIIVGNGSDELLAMAVRAFAEPDTAGPGSTPSRFLSKAKVQFFQPSYSLYPVLAEIHGSKSHRVPLNPDFSLPSLEELRRGKIWDFRAALSFITTPNAPSGHGYSTPELQQICMAQRGVVVLDEAYTDFASENALGLGLTCSNVLVARTFSKAYSLCFQRIGYFVGALGLIAALDKIRDSYNVNGLGQIAALETLNDLPYYRANFEKIIATRQHVSRALAELGFRVFPSQTNFILVAPPRFGASTWLNKFRARKILVRWFKDPALEHFLRISIGTPEEIEALVKAAKAILRRR
jgi:histidinol-phosphate aminotransferase